MIGVLAYSATALVCLSHQGGTLLVALNDEAHWTLWWAEGNSISLRTQLINGSCNVVTDPLSWGSQFPATEWTCLHEVCYTLWQTWGMSLVDLFTTNQTFWLPALVSPFQDPMAITIPFLRF